MLTQVNPKNQKKIVNKIIYLLNKKKKISPYLKNLYFKYFKNKVLNLYSEILIK